jgi:hypothetical protein
VAVRDQPGDQVLQVGPANVLDRLVTQVRQRRVGPYTRSRIDAS